MTLAEALEMGLRGTADAVQQDVDRVSQGQLPSGAIEAGTQMLLGGAHAPLKVPFIDSRMYGKLPEVTPLSSLLNHPATPGGDLLKALIDLSKPRYGILPKGRK